MKKKARDKTAEDGELRKRCLQELPTTLGVRWANDSCREMASEGRRIEGGWPGTMPEARVLLYRELSLELASVSLAPPSESELALATASTYERARHEWQRLGKQAQQQERTSEKSPRAAGSSGFQRIV
jgi:hypothetical protein